MIYDRTLLDVLKAYRIVEFKLKQFKDLTEDEQNTLKRAFFDLECLNRITSKMSEIWGKISDYGGRVISDENVREWNLGEIFKAGNFKALYVNIGDMIEVMGKDLLMDTAQFLKDYFKANYEEYTFDNLNRWEKLLFDIDETLSNIFAWQAGNVLYVNGAYNAEQTDGTLTIE